MRREIIFVPLLETLGLTFKARRIRELYDGFRQSEQALRRSEKELRDVIEAMPVMVWRTSPDGSVDFINEADASRATNLSVPVHHFSAVDLRRAGSAEPSVSSGIDSSQPNSLKSSEIKERNLTKALYIYAYLTKERHKEHEIKFLA
jgi:hypothetical protein